MSELAPQILALILLCAAFAAAFAALTARSLFPLCMHLAAFGAIAAGAVVALRQGDGAVAVALVIAAWAPLLLLAGMLLSARAAKAVNKTAPWPSLLAAGFAAGVMLIAAPDIGATPVAAGDATGLGFWLAPLLLVAGAACVGLLGYGERGALGDATGEPR